MWMFPCWEGYEGTGSSAAGQARCYILLSDLQAAAKSCKLLPDNSIKRRLLRPRKSIKSELHRLVHPMYKYMPEYSRQNNFFGTSQYPEECSCPASSYGLHMQCKLVQCTSCCQLCSALKTLNL